MRIAYDIDKYVSLAGLACALIYFASPNTPSAHSFLPHLASRNPQTEAGGDEENEGTSVGIGGQAGFGSLGF